LESLFRSDAYNLLVDVIRAELASEVIGAKLDLVTNILEEGGENFDARLQLRDAVKLQIALDVLERYADSATEKFKAEVIL